MKRKINTLKKNLTSLVERMSPNARQILVEVATTVTARELPVVLDELYNADFRWKPVDLRTFLQDPQYLGSDIRDALYPKIGSEHEFVEMQ
jgi:hypothetical protein